MQRESTQPIFRELNFLMMNSLQLKASGLNFTQTTQLCIFRSAAGDILLFADLSATGTTLSLFLWPFILETPIAASIFPAFTAFFNIAFILSTRPFRASPTLTLLRLILS